MRAIPLPIGGSKRKWNPQINILRKLEIARQHAHHRKAFAIELNRASREIGIRAKSGLTPSTVNNEGETSAELTRSGCPPPVRLLDKPISNSPMSSKVVS